MSRIELFGYSVDIDEAATRDWYAQAQDWRCDCAHCRNFLALAHRMALPAPVLAALDRLGIPPAKATYVCEIYPSGGGHMYQFSYRIAGRMLNEVDPSVQPWGEARCCHEPYPYGAPDFPEPHFDMEFWLTLPWCLDEPDE